MLTSLIVCSFPVLMIEIRELKRKTQKSAKESIGKIYMNLDIATILRTDAFKLDYKISAHKKGTSPCSG